VPDDHRRPIHRARHNPARLHRPERLALAGLLAGSRGLTREAYALDLRQFTSWCRARSLVLFTVRRADIEGFARDLEAKGRARAAVSRRCAHRRVYKYAVEEELLDHSRPRMSGGRRWITSLILSHPGWRIGLASGLPRLRQS
jgi:hypothetical protein